MAYFKVLSKFSLKGIVKLWKPPVGVTSLGLRFQIQISWTWSSSTKNNVAELDSWILFSIEEVRLA